MAVEKATTMRVTTSVTLAVTTAVVRADIDDTSLDRPKNLCCKKGAGALGLKLDRGHEGIRTHLAKLIERMRGIADGVSLTCNRAPDPGHWRREVADFRRLVEAGEADRQS